MASVLTPSDPRQLHEILQFMVARKAPCELVGAGSKRGFGRPVEAEHLIRLDGLAGIDLYEPEELVLTAAAGTRLRHIEAALATHRQMLAFEPPDLGPLLGTEAGAATIGGVLAGNLAGPRRVKMGAARDHFLGTACVSGRGEPFKSGGRVVKNVTGYDLCKLLAGSWGTLAAMTSVTVKVLPAPEDTRTILVHRLDDRRAVAAMTLAMQSPHEVSGAAHLPGSVTGDLGMSRLGRAGDAITAIRIEGFAPSVRARAAALVGLLAPFGEVSELDEMPSTELWHEIRDVRPLARLWEWPVWRLSVPPARGAEAAEAIRAALRAELLYDWAGGLLWVAVEPCDDAGEAAVRAAVAGSGGHATLARASAALRARLDVFQPQPQALAALTRRVKEGFDPYRLLNRGRMYRDL